MLTKQEIFGLMRSVGARTRFQRMLFHRYDYMFSPAQLAFLCECLDATSHLSGPIIEIGCASGATTVFLNKHLVDQGADRPYVAIDTFSGFTPEDIAVERARGKVDSYEKSFRTNKKAWVERTLRNNWVTHVRLIQADVNDLDFHEFNHISFCLVDVDLYRPVRHALECCYPRMAPGGIIVVDDCSDNGKFDGAYQAYTEFVEKESLSRDITLRKLGVIRA